MYVCVYTCMHGCSARGYSYLVAVGVCAVSRCMCVYIHVCMDAVLAVIAFLLLLVHAHTHIHVHTYSRKDYWPGNCRRQIRLCLRHA
jgi:hypothetical protein